MAELQMTEFTLCPTFEKCFQILGKKWNGLIIDVLLEEGPQRFVDLAAKIPEVSDRVLTERLKELEAQGIVGRVISCEGQKRMDYCLTQKGLSLEKVMSEVHSWGETWMA
ncbi:MULTISPECIES: winged helix-turn-helix transcriptional regulator [Enterococcus]|uniref:Helix-turn-helix transcriptional regulator n=1 Tax=Enterococcus alishanensis TaxID=1303817 RepID=A0ABS6TB83_9ENTE|nr:helix-turn-helix domain-containing protein [Enterococcus alishanensis]MBV7390129.1 helix-turn-helix transcriptional regulator [Enterococcus alishanensis]